MTPSSTYLWTRSCRMPSDENRMTFSACGTTAWTDDGDSGSRDATTARVTATERRNRLGTATSFVSRSADTPGEEVRPANDLPIAADVVRSTQRRCGEPGVMLPRTRVVS